MEWPYLCGKLFNISGCVYILPESAEVTASTEGRLSSDLTSDFSIFGGLKNLYVTFKDNLFDIDKIYTNGKYCESSTSYKESFYCFYLIAL